MDSVAPPYSVNRIGIAGGLTFPGDEEKSDLLVIEDSEFSMYCLDSGCLWIWSAE